MSTAIVTGASSGIGRELARLCAANGYDLILVARNEAQLETVAAEIRSESQRAVRIIVDDLSDAGAPQRIFAATTSELGGIEMLINNAGVGMLGFFADLDMQKQMDMLQLNINSLTQLCRLYAPGIIARKKR